MKEKISVKYVGGIGNNLFQTACAYAYSLKYNKELVLTTEKFGTLHNPIDTYKDNILSKLNFLPSVHYGDYKVYNEPAFSYQEIPFIEGNVCLTGYYQSDKNFQGYEKEIRELFSFPSELVNSIKEKYKDILDKNSCSVHVRRGDYLNFQDSHPVQSINYYMKAIRQMPEDSLFIIFSDDIEFCKSMFPGIPEKFIYIQGQKDWEDMLLMSLCKNSIIANSSFSWWGAWLGGNVSEERVVIAPSLWFGKAQPNLNPKDLYCENWIVI